MSFRLSREAAWSVSCRSISYGYWLSQNFDLGILLSKFTFPIKCFMQEFYAAGFA